MNIEEKIKEWKEEAGEIPENTCPDIDKLIKGFADLEDIISRAERRYDDVKTLADDLSWTMPDYYILEDLRKDNDKLRSLGAFWYEKCKELTALIQQERESAVREFIKKYEDWLKFIPMTKYMDEKDSTKLGGKE